MILLLTAEDIQVWKQQLNRLSPVGRAAPLLDQEGRALCRRGRRRDEGRTRPGDDRPREGRGRKGRGRGAARRPLGRQGEVRTHPDVLAHADDA